jgi:DNA ligase (NAD+)
VHTSSHFAALSAAQTRRAHALPQQRVLTRGRDSAARLQREDDTIAVVKQAEVVGEGRGSSDVPPSASELVCCVEVKVDGVALALSYRAGLLVLAATRGDGVTGDNVTENVRVAVVGRGIPETLPEPVDVDIRGEVYISPDDFAQLNLVDGAVHLANARNGAAGGLKSKDPQEAAKRMLRFVAYDCVRVSSAPSETSESGGRMKVTTYWPTQAESIEGLKAWGLAAMPDWRLCRSEAEVQEYASEIELRRDCLPFEADGVVIKVNDSVIREELGNTAKSPRGSIALKFAAVGAVTVIESVSMQVSRTGSITPVAHLMPVSIGGVTVARATLHNFDEIERLGVAIGDSVIVQRGGDVIPKIKKVKDRAPNDVRKEILVPAECPSCRGPVTVARVAEGSTTVTCYNVEQCTAQGLGRVLHFCSRNAMDITGLGTKTATKLLNSGLLFTPSDLFSLTVPVIAQLDGFKSKSASSLHSSIRDAANNRSLERVIIGLGIPGVGRASARDLALYAGTISGLISLGNANREDLMRLPNVAAKSAEAIHAFVTETRIISELLALDAAIIPRSVVDSDSSDDNLFSTAILSKASTESAQSTSTYAAPNDSESGINAGDRGHGNLIDLTGLSFTFTGKMGMMSRPIAMKGIRRFGGKVATTVSKNTSYVVVGSDPGLKHEKALRLGVPVLTEAELLSMLRAVSSRTFAGLQNSPPGVADS